MRLQDSIYAATLQADKHTPVQQIERQSLEKLQTPSFQKILEDKQYERQDVKFSKHAAVRLSQRGIEMTEGQLSRLRDGARMAQDKGIKESLVVVDQLSFIVNIPSKTVVTALDQKETMSNVFTNIDGAVFV